MASILRLQQRRARDACERDPSGVRPGTIAAGVVALMVLVGAGAAVRAGGGSASLAPPAGLVAVAVIPTAAAGARLSQPRPTLADVQAEPLPVAPKVQWQLFAGVPLPYSSTAGPRDVDGPVYSGYERSQTGALIAAVQLGVRYLLTPGDGWREVLQRQVLPGVGRDVFARDRARVHEQAPPGTYGQPAGFRIVAFTPDVAAVQLVSRFPTTGTLQVVVVTVEWVAGDWRLALQPDGGSSPTAQAVADLDGFVVWDS